MADRGVTVVCVLVRRDIYSVVADRGVGHLDACTRRAAEPSNSATDIILLPISNTSTVL